jgi:hypothetical protein
MTRQLGGARRAYQEAGIKPRLMETPAKITPKGTRAQNQNPHCILMKPQWKQATGSKGACEWLESLTGHADG